MPVLFKRSLLASLLVLMMASCASLQRNEPSLSMQDKTWTSFDNKVMPFTAAVPEKNSKVRAAVITIHGLSGAASDFWMLDQEWPSKGIAVYGMQLRGQGHDPDAKKRGHIASSRLWQRDLLAFHRLIRKRHPNVPVYWYAESLGTLIALHTTTDLIEDDRRRPAGMIMSAPAVGLKFQASKLRLRLIHAFIRVFPWVRVSLSQMAGIDEKEIQVTAETTYGNQMAVTEHHVSRFSLRLLGEVNQMMESAGKAAGQLEMPVLVLASPHDVIADEVQVQAFFEKIKSKDKTIHWYRDSYHLLLHDKERDQVLHDATEWLLDHIK